MLGLAMMLITMANSSMAKLSDHTEQFMTYFTKITNVFLLSSLLVACGAQLDSASDVKGLFNAPPKSLGQMAAEICGDIAARDTAPSTKSFELVKPGDCRDAGVRALGLNDAKSFVFTDELPGATVTEANDKVFKKAMRGQLWLNRQMSDLIPLFAGMMSGGKPIKKGIIDLPSSVAKFDGLITPEISLLDDPKIDADNLTINAPLHVKTTGVVKMELDIYINAKIFGNGVAVTISTNKPEPAYEQSLIKSIEAFVYVVPYAEDIYIDMSAGFKMYDLGTGGLIDKTLNTLAGSGLKSMLDALMKIGGQT